MKLQIVFCMFLQFFTCRVVCSSYILPTSKQLFKLFCFFVVFFTFPFFSCAKISGVRVRGEAVCRRGVGLHAS